MPVEIAFGSSQHTKLLSAFQERLRIARSGLSQRSQKWADNEDMLKSYIKTSDSDRLREGARRNGNPQYTTIEVPYSYAMMLTLHTYISSVFLSRTPVLQVSGRHGESQQAEMCIEALLDYQLSVGKWLPHLYVWMLDPLRYGHGVIGHYWDQEVINTTELTEEPETFLGVPIPGKTKKVKKTVQLPGYVGNRLYNVRPQDFLFDPRVPIMHFQQGEFVIRFNQIGWNQIIQGQAQGKYFNVAQAKVAAAAQPRDRDMGSSQTNLPDNGWLDTTFRTGEGDNPTRVNLHEFYFELIPSEFGLTPSNLPERWVFTVVNERLIIGAQPLGLFHNQWPFDVLEYEIGGYELFNRSAMEITKSLNDTITWLFNSHFYNVRKTLNDQFFVDPSMVEMRDLTDPNPGRLVRLKPAAFGKPIDSFVKQFPVVDVTRSNMADTEAVSQLAQRVLGATDNIMGQVNASGRKTATEVRSSTTFGVNRIKTTAEWQSACGWGPMTQKLIQSTQQLYDMERKFRIVGDLSQWGARYMMVTPQDIAGFYDFVPVDGTMPIDRFAQANLWQQILSGLSSMPQIMAAYDMPKMFAFVAQLAGLKNITQFRVVPDATMQQNIEAGNSVPISEGNPAEPGQIPNLGATG